jgi:tetratricopeptide (TPR) repeat protein/cold shock CspA family protein
MSVLSLPLPVRHAIESGRAVLFIGAGIGFNAHAADGSHMPVGKALAKDICTHFGIDPTVSEDLAKIAQLVEIRHGRAELDAFLSTRFANFEPDGALRWLMGRTWRAIYTTNYDRVIERCYELNGSSQQRPVTISGTSKFKIVDPRFEIPIYHLHGALFDVDERHLLLTQKDYARFKDRRKMLFEVLKQEMSSSTIIYLGYSHDDPNWLMVHQELMDEFAPSGIPVAYRVTPTTPDVDREILKAQNVLTLDGTITEFVAAASADVGELRVDPTSMADLRKEVPSDLIPHFETNAASVLRLLSSWTYVNQAEFSGSQNVAEFLRGERPSWALIAGNANFKRDVEDLVMEGLLDFATATKGSRRVLLVLGSAGYGITTTLMSLGVELVKQNAGPVLMHKPGTPVLEGDIAFAVSIFSTPPFFVVDDAAATIRALESALEQVKALRKIACFLLGERKNEWKQLSRHPKASEYEIKPLSDAEIERLLTCLSDHGELGELGSLEHDLQVAAIQKKHEKQLLVVLREVTEGKAFDAIIEAEYQKLPSLAKQCYAAVSGAYQLKQHLRDYVLAAVVGKDLTEMYANTNDSLDGVIEYDIVDVANHIYAARCRHHSIAQLVWERCVPSEDREQVLLGIVRSLNLAYATDFQLFDQLIQSDRTVDVLRSLTSKTEFFEQACRKQPDNAYVRQHYSRMLIREKRYELALREIDSALKMRPVSSPLHHTRGYVLSAIMMSSSSADIARRRMVQAEGAFQEAILRNKRDAFSYHGLAFLYFNWARRFADDQEAVDYINRAQHVVADGLRAVHDRERLLMLSSEIEIWIGNQPKALQILEKAAVSSVGVYVLASVYLGQCRYDEAKKVIAPAILADPTNERLALQYARTILALGARYNEAISVLRLADLYGMRDARFVGTLGGLYYLDSQFTESKKVFTEALNRQFPIDEQQAVVFRPHDPDDPGKRMRRTGVVHGAQWGFAFIQASGSPDVFCRRSRLGGRLLSNGQKVSFSLAFNARGPIAEDLTLI